MLTYNETNCTYLRQKSLILYFKCSFPVPLTESYSRVKIFSAASVFFHFSSFLPTPVYFSTRRILEELESHSMCSLTQTGGHWSTIQSVLEMVNSFFSLPASFEWLVGTAQIALLRMKECLKTCRRKAACFTGWEEQLSSYLPVPWHPKWVLRLRYPCQGVFTKNWEGAQWRGGKGNGLWIPRIWKLRKSYGREIRWDETGLRWKYFATDLMHLSVPFKSSLSSIKMATVSLNVVREKPELDKS